MLEKKKSEYNFINSLSIQNFRNHESLELTTKSQSVIIHGKNGVGKTSILEALSIFSNSRGLRNSKLIDMTKIDQDMFCVTVNIETKNNIIVELKSTYSKSQKIRKVYINGKEKKGFSKTTKVFPMLWITPYDEKVFKGPGASKRAFLDRIVSYFDEYHAGRINDYNKLLQQRVKVLKENRESLEWLDALEDQLSKLAVSICYSRIDILSKLSIFLKQKLPGLPSIQLEFVNSIENYLLEKPAIKIEEDLKIKYLESRKLDLIMGGSLHGCHKTEIIFFNLEKNISADMCSSGEQKLLLISIILACAKAIKKSTEIPPIMLLDEIFTHLDSIKKSYLFNELISLGSQIWITSTETDNFLKKCDNVYYYDLKIEKNSK